MRNGNIVVYLLLLALSSGCATFDAISVRRTGADAFLADLDECTTAVLGERGALDLDQCIAIALENNLDIKHAELEARLATLGRRIAFANFLPEVTFDYTTMELNNAPTTALFGSVKTSMQDRIVRETALQAQMPIFAPATWFLYALHQRGEEISGVALDYTRQMIALQVTGLYFQCLATRESGGVFEAQRDAAAALAREIEAYHSEGLVTDADIAQVRVLFMAREQALTMNGRAYERNLAELLTAMGCAPTADIGLAASMPLELPQGALDDWILEALLNHPRLAIADRLEAIEREKVRIAVAGFLPALVGFASRSHTSNSFLAYPYVSAFGFTGLMTVFNGFANVNEYRAARVGQEKAFLAREQESLALMLEVVKAHANLADAQANLELAAAAADAAEIMLNEENAKMREGLLRPSEMLDTVARHDEAQVNAVNAQYQEQVMIAITRNVLGATYRGKEDANNE
ncbi:MAG TPA: TolC family protein [Candidatus Hydrogenedentes bacterium]|nr:TolC family protein [Candidatus Hydrogenedentota bacterium]